MTETTGNLVIILYNPAAILYPQLVLEDLGIVPLEPYILVPCTHPSIPTIQLAKFDFKVSMKGKKDGQKS